MLEGVRVFPGLGLEGGQGSVRQEVGGAQAEERELQAGRLRCAEEGRVPGSPVLCPRPAPGTLLHLSFSYSSIGAFGQSCQQLPEADPESDPPAPHQVVRARVPSAAFLW